MVAWYKYANSAIQFYLNITVFWYFGNFLRKDKTDVPLVCSFLITEQLKHFISVLRYTPRFIFLLILFVYFIDSHIWYEVCTLYSHVYISMFFVSSWRRMGSSRDRNLKTLGLGGFSFPIEFTKAFPQLSL